MLPGCSTIETGGPFLSGMLNQIDCQAQTLGTAGYQALASPASGLSPLLTLALTIFVALIGYRLLIGNPPHGRELVLGAVKVGIVLLLATSWPAFHTLAYDVVMRGPAELAQSIGEPAGVPGASGGLVDRLQYTDDGLSELLVRGSGPSTGVMGSGVSADGRWIPFDTLYNRSSLDHGRTLFLTSSIASFASVRLIAGLLLALGPLFALFLLFDGTRGLFEGWLRGLVGAALGATGTAIVLGIELALIEPLLTGALALRRAGTATPAVPVELLVLALVFALVLLAVLIASAKIAFSFRLPTRLVQSVDQLIASRQQTPAMSARSSAGVASADDDRSRALAVADAVAATQRREQAFAGSLGGLPTRATMISSRLQEQGKRAPVAGSGVEQRRIHSRVSASATRRSRT